MNKIMLLLALSFMSFHAAQASPFDPTDACSASIGNYVKRSFPESFYRGAGRSRRPLRDILQVDCEQRNSARTGNDYLECVVLTTAVLDANGEEVGAGDQSYTVRASTSCRGFAAWLSGEE